MSVYNAEKYLDEAIASILKQTYCTFEFIIINDGSTDNSLNIIHEYMQSDNRIILIDQPNYGLPYSLNAGLSIARGKYIARMDADDISFPKRFEYQVSFMERNPRVGVCGTWAEVFGSSSGVIKHPLQHNELKAKLLFNVCFAHPTVMIRLDVLRNNNIEYDLKYANSQDYKLWSELVDITEFANVPKVLLKYRITSSSITTMTDKSRSDFRYKLLSGIFMHFFDKVKLCEADRNIKIHFTLGLKDRIINSKVNYTEMNRYFKSIVKANDASGYYNRKSLKKELSFRFISVFYFNLQSRKGFPLNALLHSFFYLELFSLLKRKFLGK